MPPKHEPVSVLKSKILYVDDDKDDCIFLLESFAACGNDNLICASNGEEAISYLSKDKEDDLPSLIILDLNMPKKNGRETLNYLKSTPNLANIPVVVLSTSENDKDKEDCVHLGAVSYMKKPVHYSGYKEIVKNCISYIKD